VEAEVPARIETYPYTYYDGGVVYWVGDRWYTQRNGVWIYYRSEPAYLHDYRYRYGWVGPYWGRPRRYYYRGPAPYRYRAYPRYERRQAPPAYERRHMAPPARHFAPPAGRRR
jgi:hypothetical protein